MRIPRGREDIAQLFKNCITNGKLAQAYILNAPRGMGKKSSQIYSVPYAL